MSSHAVDLLFMFLKLGQFNVLLLITDDKRNSTIKYVLHPSVQILFLTWLLVPTPAFPQQVVWK